MTTASNRWRPFDHVLVPTDFGWGAEQAAARAAMLPLGPGASVRLLHVGHSTHDALLEAHQQRVRALLQERGREDVEVTGQLVEGDPAVEIVRRARLWGTELVVMGRHTSHPLRDIFLGTTAERVLRVGDRPVLVVASAPGGPYERPLFAVTTEDAARDVLATGLRVVPRAKDPTLVHAYRVPFEGFSYPLTKDSGDNDLRRAARRDATRRLELLAAELDGPTFTHVVRHGDARRVIPVEAARRRADLVVLGTHGRSGLSHALVGSVAEYVVRVASYDALVVRPAKVTFELP